MPLVFAPHLNQNLRLGVQGSGLIQHQQSEGLMHLSDFANAAIAQASQQSTANLKHDPLQVISVQTLASHLTEVVATNSLDGNACAPLPGFLSCVAPAPH